MLKVKNIVVTLLLVFSMMFVTSESIGQRQDAQLNTTYIISQPCATCSFMYISVYNKDGKVVDNVAMTNNGSSWEYNFTPNDTLRYDVNGFGDKDGLNSSFAFWFDTTLSGEQNNTTIIISDLFLLLFVLILCFLIYNKHKEIDFKSWDEKNMNQDRNMSKSLVDGLIYGLIKNVFIWYYFLGWIFILILKDIIYRFNSAEIYSYFVLMANIYSLGFLLVIVYMIGWFATYIRDTANVLSDNNWGIENGK